MLTTSNVPLGITGVYTHTARDEYPPWIGITHITNSSFTSKASRSHPDSRRQSACCVVDMGAPFIAEIFQPHVVEILASGLNLRDYNTFTLTNSGIRLVLRSEREMIEGLKANNYSEGSLKRHEKHLYMELLKKCNPELYAKLNPKSDKCSPICKEVCVSVGSVTCGLMPFAVIGILTYLRYCSSKYFQNTHLIL
ncbi:hypothetical protein [Candidatus Fukatsuia endosymbiont of Tuberolachnus salignus]|uniref:hypothetical protein n=1 Tax=Candidatus Fukatsuia endosymbiont of Tuberolachnus salignus TaxID=3077957 RepID=UPI00313E2745